LVEFSIEKLNKKKEKKAEEGREGGREGGSERGREGEKKEARKERKNRASVVTIRCLRLQHRQRIRTDTKRRAFSLQS